MFGFPSKTGAFHCAVKLRDSQKIKNLTTIFLKQTAFERDNEISYV